MQHYSNVGQSETRVLNIDVEVVREYQRLCGYPLNEEIPILFFARYWQEFDIFCPFVKKQVMLVETEVEWETAIKQTEMIQATLTWRETQNLKRFKRYFFELSLSGQNKIRQTFIQKVM